MFQAAMLQSSPALSLMRLIICFLACFAKAPAHARRLQVELNPGFIHAEAGSSRLAYNHPAISGKHANRHAVASVHPLRLNDIAMNDIEAFKRQMEKQMQASEVGTTLQASEVFKRQRPLQIEEVDVKGKRVFIRVDFNVPQDARDPSIITNTARIDEALPTIKGVLDKGARSVVLASHLGRPNGEIVEELSMKPVAKILEEKLGKNVTMLPAWESPGREVEKACANPAPGSVLMMENLRWNVAEVGMWTYPDGRTVKPNSAFVKEFRRSIAKCADIYCNDAFSTAHRAHSSMLGEGFDIRCSGQSMTRELNGFAKLFVNPAKPVLAIFGGSDVTGKMQIIDKLLDKVDKMIIGGALAMTFLKATDDMALGESSYDREAVGAVTAIMFKANTLGVDIILPVDFTISSEFGEDGEVKEVSKEDGIPDGFMALDCGPKSAEINKAAVEASKTIYWNGAVGAHEMSQFEAGTRLLVDAIAAATATGATAIIGGDDTAAACKKYGMDANVTRVEGVGGGAWLELMEGRGLPAVEVFNDASDYVIVKPELEDSGPPTKGTIFTQEETDALYQASISTQQALSPEAALQKYGSGSKLLDAFNRPQIFYSLLRKPSEDPSAEVWDVIREQWPVLAERSNAELVEALAPIKEKYVDLRSLGGASFRVSDVAVDDGIADQSEQPQGPSAKGTDFTEEETKALYEASISKEDACTPEYAANNPGSKLLNAFSRPQILYSLLRKPSEDPPAEVWDVIRERWPVLAERSNSELVQALAPIKSKFVDLRFLK